METASSGCWFEPVGESRRSISAVAGPGVAERLLVHVLVPWCLPFLGALAVPELGQAADRDVAASGCPGGRTVA